MSGGRKGAKKISQCIAFREGGAPKARKRREGEKVHKAGYCQEGKAADARRVELSEENGNRAFAANRGGRISTAKAT